MGNCTVSFEPYGSRLPIEQRGVRLQVAKDVMNALKDVHKSIARKELGRTPSPGEVVVHGYVKEVVDSLSLAEHLTQSHATSAFVGPCNVFLSHTWGSPFKETIAALEEYENKLPLGTPPCFYFIDYFAINQFNPGKDLDKLGEIVQGCKTVLLLAQPWNQPKTLTRAWCIFEIAHAVVGNTDLQLIMTAKEIVVFKDALARLKSSANAHAFLSVFTKINSRGMQSSKPEDREKIEKFILEKLGGFDRVDLTVSSGLRKWIGRTAVDLCDTFIPNGTVEHARFLIRTNGLFSKIGMYEVQLINARRARKIFEGLNIVWGLEVSMADEAVALSGMGKHDESVRLEKELLELYIKKYGDLDKKTLRARKNLGVFYMEMDLWEEAEAEFTAVLEGHKKLECPMSIGIRGAQKKLARVLRDSGKNIERAKLLYKECLDYKMKYWGPEDPTVLSSEIDYARCLALKGDNLRALKQYRRAFPVLLKKYGENRRVKDLRMWINEAEQLVHEKKE